MARLTDEIVGALKTVYDPEIPADIYELGLIYKVGIDDDCMVNIEMTLTTPNCPSAEEMPQQVENAVAGVPGIRTEAFYFRARRRADLDRHERTSQGDRLTFIGQLCGP